VTDPADQHQGWWVGGLVASVAGPGLARCQAQPSGQMSIESALVRQPRR